MRVLCLVAASAASGLLCAQTPPRVENANVQTSALPGSLKTAFAAFSSSGAGPYWAAWQEAIVPGRHGEMCWSNGNNDYYEHAAGDPVRLEGPTALLVMVRIENAQVDQLRVASPECRFDGGGLPFHWVTGVPAGESVAWLKLQIAEWQATDKSPDRALLAIALHAGPAATQALDEMTAPTQTESVRERVAVWLGNSRGAQGVEALRRMLANDPSERVRERVLNALSQSKEPTATAIVIETAKNDKTARLRSRALVLLAQRASNKQAQEVIRNATLNDPELTVKKQAVLALKQMPEDQGVPLLIDVAKNNPDPAVRKTAMTYLGQSQDRRAVDFFAQVLATPAR